MNVNPSVIHVTHFSDPGCPWAWSAGPALATLQWRYGGQLAWRHVMIGLAETGEVYEARGYTGEAMARGYVRFRDRGMPFATAPRSRVHGTWPMCLVVVAARLTAPEREWAVFRALQLAQFTTTLALDEPAGLVAALDGVAGIDPLALVAEAASGAVEAAFAQDRALARSAAGSPTEAQGKAAVTPENEVRFTAPSVAFATADGRRLEAGGFQHVDAYDVLLANLDPALDRRPPASDVREVIAEFPDGLTTAEVAAVMAPPLTEPDLAAAEHALVGTALRVPFGHDALWLPPDHPEAWQATRRAGGRLARRRTVQSL